MSAEMLNSIPSSGHYPEKHFGENFIAPLWVKFVDNEMNEWIGCFARKHPTVSDNVLVSNDNSTALVVAEGKAYLLNIHTKEVLHETNGYPEIQSILHTSNPEHFIASILDGIYLFNLKGVIGFSKPHFYTDGICLIEQVEQNVVGHLYSPQFSQDYNIGFTFNLITSEIHANPDKLFDWVDSKCGYIEVKKNEKGLFSSIVKAIRNL